MTSASHAFLFSQLKPPYYFDKRIVSELLSVVTVHSFMRKNPNIIMIALLKRKNSSTAKSVINTYVLKYLCLQWGKSDS